MPNEKQIAAMKRLGMSETEIAELLASDKAIDRGQRMDFDLSPEKEKMALKMANSTTKKRKTVYNFDTSNRKRKENVATIDIIAKLCEFLKENTEISCDNVEITNKERQIAFSVGEDKFELTLVQKRKPKEK
jgi:hypothetical protein